MPRSFFQTEVIGDRIESRNVVVFQPLLYTFFKLHQNICTQRFLLNHVAKDDQWLVLGDEGRKLCQRGPGSRVSCEDKQLWSVGLDVIRGVGHLKN